MRSLLFGAVIKSGGSDWFRRRAGKTKKAPQEVVLNVALRGQKINRCH